MTETTRRRRLAARTATLAATLMLGSGIAVITASAPAQAARPAVHPPRQQCATTMPVKPRRLTPYRPIQPLCRWQPATTRPASYR